MIKGWMQSDGKGLELVGRTYDLRRLVLGVTICTLRGFAFGVRVKAESNIFIQTPCHLAPLPLCQLSLGYQLL